MTYDVKERSAWDGRPVEVYEFSRGHLRWRYTSAQQNVTVNYATYEAVAIARGGIELTNELNRSALKITVARDHPVAEMWRVAPPSEPVSLVISQYHLGDEDLAVQWMGRVINVEWSGSVATIALEPTYTGVRRQGLRRKYQRGCPHVLYGAACRLSAQIYRLSTTCSGIDGNVIASSDVAALGGGYFSGGYVEWEVQSGIYERRYIALHAGAELTLCGAPFGLEVGQSIGAFPGCDHALATCDAKFGNAANYGGMPYIPVKNPFSGNPIY